MKKVTLFILLVCSFVLAQDTDVAYWRQNSGAWGKQTFTNYVSGVDTVWVGPFVVWPFQTVNITISDTSGTPVDSVSAVTTLYQWTSNDTSKAIKVRALEYKSHWSATDDSTLSAIGTYACKLGDASYLVNQFGWIKIVTDADHKVRAGIKFDFRFNGYNSNWGIR